MDWVGQLKLEYMEVSSRLRKLYEFMEHNQMSKQDTDLLAMQQYYMTGYKMCLRNRLLDQGVDTNALDA